MSSNRLHAFRDLRFPGQYYDQETGLHYNYFRDYHPGIGRYVEPDPIGLDGGINLYAYVGSSPIRSSDRSGLLGPFAGAIAACLADPPCAAALAAGALATGQATQNFFKSKSTKDITDDWPWWQENIGPVQPPCEQQPDEQERCKKVAEYCRAKCSDEALPSPRSDHGMQFFRCYNECMKEHGCL